MKAFYSEYIIDGVQQELTPAKMLDSVSDREHIYPEDEYFDPVVDETPDPLEFSLSELDSAKIQEYLSLVAKAVRKLPSFPVLFSRSCTKAQIADALIDAIWRKGHFRLGDLVMEMSWQWNSDRMGNMAALYSSVEATAEYLDSLGLRLSKYSCRSARNLRLDISTALFKGTQEDEDLLDKMPFHSDNPSMSSSIMHPDKFEPDPKSWIIYIPFDSCEFRLGGSVLSQVLGLTGGMAPDVSDADYFIDCFEVVRELVEDGVILSGATVGSGGLLTAVSAMTSSKVGARIDIGEIISSYSEKNIVRILFAEVPGAVIQIRDIDYDYVDAELLLQDVAYFPLGHPVGECGVEVISSEKSGIQNILDSILANQCSDEVED